MDRSGIARRGRLAAVLAIAQALGFALAPVPAPAASADLQARPRIVNGLETQDFPTTGALLYSGGAAINANNAGIQCSGTLIGCSTFLTAAHCVEGDLGTSKYWVYLQHSGLHSVSSITMHPSYNPALSGRDVAIVKLSSPVTGIAPTPYNDAHDLAALGTGLDGVIAGFGQTSGSGNDYGIKRHGNVVTANCNTGITGEGNDKLVCWNFTNPVGPAGEDSNTCNGDSGGPLFMDFAGVEKVVGVTSAGSSTNCLPTDHSWDASVFYNAAWIAGQLGADPVTPCGGLPAVGDPDVQVTKHDGDLSSGNPSASFTVNVAGAATELRFTLNGRENGTFNPDLFVKQGPGASASNFDCKADGSSVFGDCLFSNPASGTWSIFVRRASGSGRFQVTTSVFGGDPPVCGNGTVESGEHCDGADLGICPIGPCQMNCTCPAPVCGNGVRESGEQCDAGDDAACPGLCNGSCACPVPDCSQGDLYGLVIRSDARRFLYKARLHDDSSQHVGLDPSAGFGLDITDGSGTVSVSIPASDAGWSKSKPDRRLYKWKGDGSIDGLRRVKFRYKTSALGPHWALVLKGKSVPAGGSIDVQQVLDFTLAVDGTCHEETW